jgi:hypothetical protein
MSEAQAATPEQQERMQAAIAQAQEQAMRELQQNAQIEIQMRVQALTAAVNANNQGAEASLIASTANTFLKFLKQGEA